MIIFGLICIVIGMGLWILGYTSLCMYNEEVIMLIGVVLLCCGAIIIILDIFGVFNTYGIDVGLGSNESMNFTVGRLSIALQ